MMLRTCGQSVWSERGGGERTVFFLRTMRAFEKKSIFVAQLRTHIMVIKKQAYNLPQAKAKPFIKWVGGKGQLLATFEKMLPRELAGVETKIIKRMML